MKIFSNIFKKKSKGFTLVPSVNMHDYNGWYSFGDGNPKDATQASNWTFQFANKMIHDIKR